MSLALDRVPIEPRLLRLPIALTHLELRLRGALVEAVVLRGLALWRRELGGGRRGLSRGMSLALDLVPIELRLRRLPIALTHRELRLRGAVGEACHTQLFDRDKVESERHAKAQDP